MDSSNPIETLRETLRAEFEVALHSLQNETAILKDRVATLEATAQASPRPRQQLPEPAKFDGKAHHFRVWLPAIKAKIRVDGQAIGSEIACFYYVYNNLEALVQAMVLPQLAGAELQEIWYYHTVLSQLSRVYENPNQRQEAEDTLHRLRQNDKEPIASYVAKFERLLYEAEAQDWPDTVKISTLRTGLSQPTRKALSTQLSVPTSYTGFLRVIQQLSRRQLTYANDQDSQQYDKMDMSAITIGGINAAQSASATQRHQWRDSGRCVRCGSQSHWVANCPQQPTIQSQSAKQLYTPSSYAGSDRSSEEDTEGMYQY